MFKLTLDDIKTSKKGIKNESKSNLSFIKPKLQIEDQFPPSLPVSKIESIRNQIQSSQEKYRSKTPIIFAIQNSNLLLGYKEIVGCDNLIFVGE